MEGDFHFMSRQALMHPCNSQPPQDKLSRFTALMGSIRLPLLFVAALALTLFLASGNVTAKKLFQSPQSPPPEQPAPQQPVPEQPAPVQPAPEQPAPEQPVPEQAQPTAEQPATGQSPVEQPAPVQPAGEAAPAPTLEPLAPVTTEDEPIPGNEFNEIPPGSDDTPMVLDEAELIDSVFVSFAYIWLCCGVILLLLIPLALLILYVRGRSKIVNEESF